MRCKQVLENITAYFDGELRGKDAEVLREHLSVCSPCKEHLDELQRLETVCGIWEEIELNPKFETRFWAAVEAQEKPFLHKWMDWLSYSPIILLKRQNLALVIALFVTISLSMLVIRDHPNNDLSETPGSPEIAQVSALLDWEAGELDKLKDFDVIANLELLQYFDEAKSQLSTEDPLRQGTY